MILPYSPDLETIQLFQQWLTEKYDKKLADRLMETCKGDQGCIIVCHDDIKYENHIICCYGSFGFVEVYKMLTPTHFIRVPNNNEGLLPNTAPKSS